METFFLKNIFKGIWQMTGLCQEKGQFKARLSINQKSYDRSREKATTQ